MESIDIGFLVIALVIGSAFTGLGLIGRRFFRDRIFAGLIPGMTPALGQPEQTTKVTPGPEYSGPVAVAFNPPKGMRPGLVGTIVDGKAEMRDLSATIVDLAIRGQLQIEAIDSNSKRQNDPTKKSRDWKITLAQPAPANDELNDFEQRVMASLFGARPKGTPSITMSTWTRTQGDSIRALQDDLYAQTVANGWYERDPRRRSGLVGGVLTTVSVLFSGLVLLSHISIFTLVAVAIVIGSAIWASRRIKARVPRTALGTAAMVQALGFKKYLATAEADQFDVEEAAGIFSRYLPYAIVFGVADHWSKVFGEVSARSIEAGGPDLLEAMIWFDLSGMDNLLFFGLGALGDGAGLGELAGGIGEVAGGIGDAADGLGDFASGVGDFISGLFD